MKGKLHPFKVTFSIRNHDNLNCGIFFCNFENQLIYFDCLNILIWCLHMTMFELLLGSVPLYSILKECFHPICIFYLFELCCSIVNSCDIHKLKFYVYQNKITHFPYHAEGIAFTSITMKFFEWKLLQAIFCVFHFERDLNNFVDAMTQLFCISLKV